MRGAIVAMIVSLAVGVPLLGLGMIFIQEGSDNATPGSRLREAEREWQSGPSSQAAFKFLDGYRMALESGLRHTMARPYIDQMRALKGAGRLNEALDQCRRAKQVLDAWDEEGGLDYECFVLEERIRCTLVGDQMVCP